MNKLKGLKEKRNDLVSKQKTMLSTAIDETRSLTEEEDTELRSVIEQIKELETEIETMEEEIRTSTIVINDENDKGEDKMTKTYEEIRSEFIDYLPCRGSLDMGWRLALQQRGRLIHDEHLRCCLP